MFSRYRTIPKEAKLLIYLTFVPWLAFSLIYTDLSYFLTKVQGFSEVFTGSVITLMGVSTVLVSVPIGVLADRYGRKRFLVFGNILASVTLTVFALTTNQLLLYAAAVVEGTTEAAYATSGSAMLAGLAGDASRTPAFSFSSFLSNMAYGLGGFAIPLVLVLESTGLSSTAAHAALYIFVALLSLAMTPLLLRIPDPSQRKTAGTLKQFFPRKSKGVLLKYSATSVLIAFGAGFFVPLMTLWFSLMYGVVDSVSGPIIGVSGFLIAAVSLVAPWLAGKFGLVRAAVLGQGLSTFFMVVVPLSPTFVIAGLVYTVRSFLMNVSNPMIASMIMGLVAEDERGAAAGISAAVWKFPNSISATIGAVMMGAGYLALPFYLATAFYVVSIGLYWMFFHRVRMPEEKLSVV